MAISSPRRQRELTRKAILDMIKSHHITMEEGETELKKLESQEEKKEGHATMKIRRGFKKHDRSTTEDETQTPPKQAEVTRQEMNHQKLPPERNHQEIPLELETLIFRLQNSLLDDVITS